MHPRIPYALLLGTLSAAIALCQEFPASLITDLQLTPAQVQSIVSLNHDFDQATLPQQQQFYDLQQRAAAELSKSAPDSAVVGDSYARAEMLRRDYNSQLTQLQGRVSEVLSPAQILLVNSLVDAARLRGIVYAAASANLVKLPPNAPGTLVAIAAFYSGFGRPSNALQAIDAVLVNYLHLSEGQIAAIENANTGYSAYLARQSLKLQQLLYEIRDLTAAPDIDAARLGAEYVAMAQITSDQSAHTDETVAAVRTMINPSQEPQLRALDHAATLLSAFPDAVCNNLLVLPADVPLYFYYFGNYPSFAVNILASPRVGTSTRPNPFASNGCVAATATPS